MVKNLPANAGLIPGSGRSRGGGLDNPLQNSCWENHHGQVGLVGSSPWGCRESDINEATEHRGMQHAILGCFERKEYSRTLWM